MRRSTRSARRSRRRRGIRPGRVALAGLLTTALIIGIVYLAEESYNGLPFVSYRTVYASLPNIGHLQEHDPVDIAGVRVGQVLSTSTRNNLALVELQLQGVGPLPIDSRAIVRANGLLGGRYLELDPGTSHKTLPNNGTIFEHNPISTYYNGLPEALNLFDAKTRRGLGTMLNGFGEGVEGRGSQLNEAIHVGPTSGANFDTVANAILAEPLAAANFLPATDSGMTALNSAGYELSATFRPAANTMQPLIDERTAVDQGLSSAVGMEQQAKGFRGQGLRLLTLLQGTAAAADETLPPATQALRSATALLKAAPAPLKKTKLVLDEVPHAASSTVRILSSLRPDLSPLRRAFVNLAGPVASLAEHGCDIQNFAAGVRSLVGWGELPGGSWGPNSGFPVGLLAGPQQTAPEFNTHIPFPTENPYPAPCAYSPGPTIDNTTLTGLLGGVLR